MERERYITVVMIILLVASFSYVLGSTIVKNNYLITGMATGVGGGDDDIGDLCGNGVCNLLNGEDSSNCAEDCFCGDGVVDDSEECDGGNLNFRSCSSFGYNSGSLSCSNCAYDTSGCSNEQSDSGDDDSSCGDGICDASETCGSCVEDCVWENADCGNNGICYLNRGFGWCMPICVRDEPSVCVCGEQWFEGAPYGMQLNTFGPDETTGCSDQNCQGERAYCYVFPSGVSLPNVVSVRSNTCSDGSSPGRCSLTQPLYCDDRKELVYDCSICGCGAGYDCGENGICLISDSVPIVNGNATVNQSLWRQLENEYSLIEGSERVSELIQRGIDEEVLLSSGSIITDVVKVENLQGRLAIPDEIVANVDNKVKRTSEALVSDDVDEITELFEVSSSDVIGGAAFKGVLNTFSDVSGDVPVFSGGDIVDVACVDIAGGSCLGESECCSGLVCNAGICVDNSDVESVGVDIGEGFGLSSLVSVTGANVENVVEYETHPDFVEGLDIPDSVNFGFYDISVSSVSGGVLEFDVLNDLLVLNQIVAVGLYRLTDDGWESLDLVNISYNAERTTFTFETSGFSYFTLRGIKEGVSFDSVTSQDEGLWAVYRRSFTPGFSLIEFFFGPEDTLIFGILNDKPLLDLGLGSGF